MGEKGTPEEEEEEEEELGGVGGYRDEEEVGLGVIPSFLISSFSYLKCFLCSVTTFNTD